MSDTAKHLEQHYKAEEVAAKLGLKIDTVWRHCREGKIRSVQFGRSRRIPESALLDYLHGEMAQVYQLREAENGG